MLLETVVVADEAGTTRLAEDVAAILAPGDVIALSGDLGMGKSAFARALLRALAADDVLEVPSPTFTLVQTYETRRLAVAHFDLYRLGDAGELDEIGFDEAIRAGAALVEWPDRAAGRLPRGTVHVTISPGEACDGRVFRFEGDDAGFAARFARSRRVRALLDAAGLAGARRRHVQGDASARSHERATAPDGRSLMVMTWPKRPAQPPLLDGLSYPDLVHVTDDPLKFVAVSALLEARGFRAPVVRAYDPDHRLLVQDDLGAEGILADGRPVPERYLAAAELLAEKDAETWPDVAPLPDGGGVAIPAFDTRAMTVELSLAPDWYVRHVSGADCPPEDRTEFVALWAPLVGRLQRAERGLVLRDVHSPNLTWLGGSDRRRRLGLIDHQDAMIGPAVYDLTSLATDVRVDVPPELAAAIRDRYCAVRAERGPYDRAAFDEAFALVSAQRNTKILGGFARSAVRDGKTTYLGHLPRVRRLLAEALEHPVLAPLKLWYERRGFLP
ncbi:tRNA (adenosine(37)-N6)-threonylcarbamoyltransferase complex ATPase subunit type 1 TsaE [Oharaeibacter diazotrophicus]|uniref:tRNA threonylcarbamoyladenosine biosynthesis protein TsaE n=3 Tax=Oharaeibacter diazotrophicus TaxID=1920512 RepID=A0A4R6RDT2_9HYPH|nr:tRNA (adenosine(37)-N6)-threonylcarbamoyltransferase complex ATPase subunit type 1 TsaE [Oharaeibacter diazotrophicus]TDP84312.1 hypothetical protein EDD54_2918 [Oharaeibacter diazotrophicus]BBE73349.1 tRNA threonylcarbamoyladenosine biosynthesis protein TsaE [Pleomorphomonas sp. SM30]GLS75140.1 bifunctional tRNA (adenosine(37)-N6)-threonylcarbamoyltransferase complex ATPase subunit type 1 TsaE/phosphotransferase [Oharaeibacter diazotrophicus]